MHDALLDHTQFTRHLAEAHEEKVGDSIGKRAQWSGRNSRVSESE